MTGKFIRFPPYDDLGCNVPTAQIKFSPLLEKPDAVKASGIFFV